MKKYISVVIEYEDGQEQPSFHVHMELLGGKITGVMFDDALLALERAESEVEEYMEMEV